MRVQTSLQLALALTTLATISACGSYGARQQPDPNYAGATIAWDSGPLDNDYHRQRNELDNRHADETAHPRADESSDQRVQRQGDESKDLETRYAQGKASHASSVPPSDRQLNHTSDSHQ
jgi:hypothetical protein